MLNEFKATHSPLCFHSRDLELRSLQLLESLFPYTIPTSAANLQLDGMLRWKGTAGGPINNASEEEKDVIWT